jgi:hypothetical protein
MRVYVGLATAILPLVALSCDGATRPHGRPIHMLQAHATAVRNDTVSYCGITTSLARQLTSLPPWGGRTTVSVSRWVSTTGAVLANRDTLLDVSFTVGQNADRLVFALGAPLNDTLIGSVLDASTDTTGGTWTCPATMPFGDNSVLVSKGYQAVPAPSGRWSLRWLLPVD